MGETFYRRCERRVLYNSMKLVQGQVWKKGDDYYRIVERERLAIRYKHIQDLVTREGAMHVVTKKEFCRLIQGAELTTLEPMAIDETPPETPQDPPQPIA